MKLKPLLNRVVNKAETEAYRFAYIKYRRFVLDVVMVVCILASIFFSGKGIAQVSLGIAFMLALFRLEETIFSMRKADKQEHDVESLKEKSLLEEAKRIIKAGNKKN